MPSTTPPKPSKPFHRRLPLPTTTPKCEKLTEKQKYAKLENIGGRNQQFMANTPEEASLNFPHLLPKHEATEPTAAKPNSRIMMSDAVMGQVSFQLINIYGSYTLRISNLFFVIKYACENTTTVFLN